MKIIYISTSSNPENTEKINKTAKKKLQVNGIKFHNLILEGFQQNNVEVKSIIGLPISIKDNKRIIWKKQIDTKKNIEYVQIGFINLPIIKQICLIVSICKRLKKECKNNSDLCVIIDTAYVTVLPFIVNITNKLGIKTVGLTADIYNYMCDVDNDTKKGRLIPKIFRKIMSKAYAKLNGFILLTEQMNEVINKNKRPYIVMEGLVDINENKKTRIDKSDKKIILYSGALYEKFGVKNLIDAFKQLKQKDVELHLYGFGELESYVKEVVTEDSRIKFFGMVSNEVVVAKQKEATILVNPRPTSEEFTKYSFPSKNMEYMVSGTPMISTKLAGIPKEYYDYIYTFEDDSIEGIKNGIEGILKIDKRLLEERGSKAKEFVLKYKNNKIQANKIIKFIEQI